ncbi:MAG TPA: flagellar protein FlgN [Candidatus Gastranaerophilales bacterium]|nr:flagellar protein FlgN [Candidatus Gastranaerophilales bacterium]
MEKDILELEQILEQEIEACSKLEQYINDKKNYLVKGDIQGVMKIDVELDRYNSAVERLEEKRRQLFPDQTTLKNIIDSMEEKNKALYIQELRDKLNNTLLNAQKQNNINAELIKHSLKIIESSIASIVNVLVPESISYNRKGKVVNEDSSEVISSVIHEA